MISEFAVMPDVFEATATCAGDAHDTCIAQLTDLLMNDGVVRDLRAGEWQRSVLTNIGRCTAAGRELFGALVTASRLRPFAPSPLDPPTNPEEWLYEAWGSEEMGIYDRRLQAALATPELAEQQADEFVVSIQRLHATAWWKRRSCSVRLSRTTQDYLQHLGSLFRHSNSLLFIDPNLDPTKPNYAEFFRLLEATVSTQGKPDLIEIHRSCKDPGGPTIQDQYPSRSEWVLRFDDLGNRMQAINLSAHVFIWDDFHDRYLISNLIGLSIPNGFDICTDPRKFPLKTTWTRLCRKDADEVRSDFDPANSTRLRWNFPIGV